jgi:predicted glutamine amidotransferase
MCIAILNTKKAGRLPKKQIQNSWDNNDMGAGLLWNKGNKLSVFKSYDYDDYLEKYNELRDDKSIGNIVLHFRIATSGYNGEHNLHPFLTNDNLGFVHNGVIKGLGNKSFSDTYEFNDMLKKFSHNFLNCDMTKYFISEYIGYSKLVFLDNKDKYTIINEELGKWSSGNWYSNDSYKEYKPYVYYGNQKVAKGADKTVDFSVKWDDMDVWDNLGNAPSNTTLSDDEELYDEWEIYEYLCDLYGLDPNDEESFKDIEMYMALNNVTTISELYDAIVI